MIPSVGPISPRSTTAWAGCCATVAPGPRPNRIPAGPSRSCRIWSRVRPSEQADRRNLAQSLTLLAALKCDHKEWSEAEALYREAITIQEQLIRDDPGSHDYREEEAASHWRLAIAFRRSGRPIEAGQEYRNVIELEEKLTAEFPSNLLHRFELPRLMRELAVLLSDHGDEAGGAAIFPKAIGAIDRLAAEYPSMPNYRLEQELCLMSYGKFLGETDRPVEASEQFRRAIAVGEKLVAEDPAGPWYKHTLGLSCGYFANVIRDGNNPAGSLEWYDKALPLLTEAYRRDPREDLANSALYKCHGDHARALDLLGRPDEAILELDRAMGIAPASMKPGTRAIRTISLVRAGQLQEALAELDELTRSDSSDPSFHHDLARAYALAGANLPANAVEFGKRAIEQLEKAMDAGFQDRKPITNNPDFALLRDRADFRKLLAHQQEKCPPRTARHPR